MNTQEGKKKWIERKDLVYWLLIVSILWLLSSDYGKKNLFVIDNWNFASTIVSIILAVLAIVYTYAQSSSTLLTTKKLEDSATIIVNASLELQNISIDSLFTQLEIKVSKLIKEVDNSVKSEFSKHKDLMQSYFGSTSSESPFDTNMELFTQAQWEILIQEKLNKKHMEATLFLHYYYQQKYNIKYKLLDIAKQIMPELEKNNNELIMQAARYLLGVTKTYESLNVFKTENIDQVVGVSEQFIGAVEAVISRNPSTAVVLEVTNYLRKAFPNLNIT